MRFTVGKVIALRDGRRGQVRRICEGGRVEIAVAGGGQGLTLCCMEESACLISPNLDAPIRARMAQRQHPRPPSSVALDFPRPPLLCDFF